MIKKAKEIPEMLKELEGKEGNLFDPATKEFQNWNTFLGEKLEYDKMNYVLKTAIKSLFMK